MIKLIIALIFAVTFVQAEVKLKTKSKGVVSGDRIEYSAGEIKLYPEKNNNFNIKIGLEDVLSVQSKKPSQLSFLEKYFLEGKGELIANKKGLSVLQGNYVTGWGKKSAFFLAMAYIKQKKFSEAESVLKKARVQIPGNSDKEDQLLLKLAESYLYYERGRPEFLISDLNKIAVPSTALGKMFYYQLQGMLLEKGEKSSEAVLAYYKGIMLGVKSQERVLIQNKIENIYKSQKDPRRLPNLNQI